jgi:molybdopterin-containing oxidoreductase family iron-sulfur binding subunit
VIENESGRIEAVARVHAGVVPDVVLVPQGEGHTAMGRFAKGRGVNVLRLFDGTLGDFLCAGAARTGTRVAIRRPS